MKKHYGKKNWSCQSNFDKQCPLFVNAHKVVNVNGGVGGQKKNLVHVVCENPIYGIINKLEIYLLHDSAEN